MDVLVVVLALALITSLAVVGLLLLLWRRTSRRLRALHSSSRSQSTRYGRISEQFMPFLRDYPWDPGRFRFIGSPVDGVQFEDEQVVFVEFKVGTSSLTRGQRHIRDLIRAGRVDFKEFRLD